jgi:hypothetical protein
LQTTDYGNFLANEPSPLSVSVIDDKLREKYVLEFQHLRNHSVEPLAKFLDYITYSYMIDNIVLLITGHLHQRSIQELLPKCHPLGMFEQMGAITVADNSASLYNAILIDTPLAPYFIDCISEHDLDELNIEIMRNTLYKSYLEDFYAFCKQMGGATAEVMCELLAVRSIFFININQSKSIHTVLPNSHFFTRIRVNSRNFTLFRVNLQMFTLFHQIFFLPVLMANNAQNSLSWAFSKKSCVLKTIHVTSSYRKNNGLCVSIETKRKFVLLCFLK